MANFIGLIEKYQKDVLDTVFATESKTALLESTEKWVDLNFKEAGYVKIASLLLDGLSDYYRVNHVGVAGSGAYAHDNSNNLTGARDGYHRANASLSWEILKLEYDRGTQFLVDNMDNEESAGLVIANLLKEFIRTKVVPEVDATRFAKIARKCNVTLGNLVSETIQANQIVGKWNTAFAWLTEHGVPEEDQVIFVNPQVYASLLSSTELTRYITQEDFRSERGVTFALKAYMGRAIVVVPSDRFYTDIVVGENGYYPSTIGKVINYLICSKKAIVPVVKLEKSKVWTPDTQDDFDGYKVNYRLYHDCFIPKNKIVGCFCSVSTTNATTVASKLDLALSAGVAQNAYRVDGVYTSPAGMLGTVVTAQSAFTLGETVVVDGDDIKTVDVEGGDNINTNANTYFALIDGSSKVIATSGQITLTGVKKA